MTETRLAKTCLAETRLAETRLAETRLAETRLEAWKRGVGEEIKTKKGGRLSPATQFSIVSGIQTANR